MSNVPMTLPDLVIATLAAPLSHTSSFTQFDDGRLFHASFGICNYLEDGGGCKGRCMVFYHSDDGGKEPADNPALSCNKRKAVLSIANFA